MRGLPEREKRDNYLRSELNYKDLQGDERKGKRPGQRIIKNKGPFRGEKREQCQTKNVNCPRIKRCFGALRSRREKLRTKVCF